MKKSIKKYLEENVGVIEGLALLIAISIFSESLSLSFFTTWFPVVSLTMVAILLGSLIWNFSFKEAGIELVLFFLSIIPLVLLFLIYWLLKYNDALGGIGLGIIIFITPLFIFLTFIPHNKHSFKTSPWKWVLYYGLPVFLFACLAISIAPWVENLAQNADPTRPVLQYSLSSNSSSSYNFAVENTGLTDVKNLTVLHLDFSYSDKYDQITGLSGKSSAYWTDQGNLTTGEIFQNQFSPQSLLKSDDVFIEVFDATYERAYDSKSYEQQAIFFIDQGSIYTYKDAENIPTLEPAITENQLQMIITQTKQTILKPITGPYIINSTGNDY